MRAVFILRSLLASLVLVVTTAISSTIVIVQNMISPNRKLDNFVIHQWARFTLWSFGVRIKATGQENVKPGTCLFLFTHTSFFDIFSMQASFPEIRFGAKIELFSIPIFGRALRRVGNIPIARGQREEVFKVYEEAKERAKNGERFALAPEGARTDGEGLKPFKTGPFVFAINSGMPLVPVIIRGAKEVMGKKDVLPNTRAWISEISVHYCPAISVEGYSMSNRGELQQKTREQMLKVMSEA
jgi:1-acyl-sn-glycerol-3-phosphate acyltransferase